MNSIRFSNFSVANNFSQRNKEKICLKTLILKKSKNSSLLYLKKNFNLTELNEKNKIISYSEPEDHINDAAKLIIKKANFQNFKVLGVSSKDISLVNQIKKIRKKTYTKIFYQNGSLESAIKKFYQNNIKKKFNILILRHIWEHIPDQKLFFKKIKKVLDKKHIIYIEVPDCKRLIENFDYSMIWEEHYYYYNQQNLLEELQQLGLKKIKFLRVPHPQEDNLCVLLNIKENQQSKKKVNKRLENFSTAFLERFNTNKNKTKIFFSKLRKKGFKFGFFGASHMLNTFLNVYGLKKYSDYIIDDNPKKIDKFFADLESKIISFEEVKRKNIKKIVFFISCNMSVEDKIIRKLKTLNKKVLFFSIFPLSKNYFIKKKLHYENKKKK